MDKVLTEVTLVLLLRRLNDVSLQKTILSLKTLMKPSELQNHLEENALSRTSCYYLYLSDVSYESLYKNTFHK